MCSIIWKGLVEGLIEAHLLRCSTEPDFDFGAVVWDICNAHARGLDRSPATEAERTLGCCLGSHFDDVMLWLVTKREGKQKPSVNFQYRPLVCGKRRLVAQAGPCRASLQGYRFLPHQHQAM